MSGVEVTIVPTRTANLASVLAALKRAGATTKLCESPAEIEGASHVVLPGVGTLAAAMERLEADGFVAPIRERLQAGRSTFAVCLGLQLLCEGSDESPDVRGFGVAQGRVSRFDNGLRVPQVGWNEIVPQEGPESCRFLRRGYVYYTNSYRLVAPPPGWRVAMTDYGGSFVAAMERDDVLACQFHPELSGRFGLDIIKRWLGTDEEASSC